MKRNHSEDFDQIAGIIGRGDSKKGRVRLSALCDVGTSAISNWKSSGIPKAHRATIFAYLKKSELDVPTWLMDLDVPVGSDAIDEIIARSADRRKAERVLA